MGRGQALPQVSHLPNYFFIVTQSHFLSAALKYFLLPFIFTAISERPEVCVNGGCGDSIHSMERGRQAGGEGLGAWHA